MTYMYEGNQLYKASTSMLICTIMVIL